MNFLELKTKAETFDRIMRHLKNAKETDERRREQIRCGVAMRKIGSWYKEEQEKIEKTIEVINNSPL